MPLCAKLDDPKLPKMATSQENGEKPKTGIKVIIIGAGTSPPKSSLQASVD
jgi:hypothetical protein